MSTSLVPVKTEDFLEQDPELRGQKYVCMSFISPEDVIQKKELYFFENFITAFSKEMGSFLDQMKEKYNDDRDVTDTISAVRSRYDYLFDSSALKEEYKLYVQSHSEKLESEYLELNSFRTSVRGIKVRGSFESLKEAQNRAEKLRKNDPCFDVYVGQVGCWCPWSPNPDDIEDSEYAETQMNTLMKSYKENMEKKDQLFQERKDLMVQQVKMHPKNDGASGSSKGTDPAPDADVTADTDDQVQSVTPSGALANLDKGDDPWFVAQGRASASNSF